MTASYWQQFIPWNVFIHPFFIVLNFSLLQTYCDNCTDQNKSKHNVPREHVDHVFFLFFFLNLVRHFHLPVKMSVHQPAHYPFTLSRLTFALFFHDEWLIKMYFSSRSCPSADESVTYFKGKNDLDLRTWYTPLNIPRTTVSAWW